MSDGYTTELVPIFERFARDALQLADVVEGEALLDVACGPGTLSLLAADRTRVCALDFSERMLSALEARARERGVSIEVKHGDGMALPWADGSFDAAFSMFGLMFFPDRAKGLKELHRVLRPGGRAVVSGWVPMERVPVLAAFMEALRAELPNMPAGPGTTPFGEPEAFRSELELAGFVDVEIHDRNHGYDVESPRAFLEFDERCSAPFALLRRSYPKEGWPKLVDALARRLEERFGPGPMHVDMPALLGIGRR